MLQFAIPCLLGLESLVGDEVKKLGLADVRVENGRVLCRGEERDLARLNINLRCGARVLLVLASFRATDFETLFQGTRAVRWEDWIPREGEFPVTGYSINSTLHSVPACQSIVKKAVVERLGAAYGLEKLPETGKRYQIRFSIMKDEVMLCLDASGEGLYKRGYRAVGVAAPLKETLAAAMAKLSRVRTDGTLIDPFCGSGTIAIEAAMIAQRRAPGLLRRFDAEKWSCFDKKVWQQAREDALCMADATARFDIVGSDIDPDCVQLSIENARKAGVANTVFFERADATKRDYSNVGVLFANPPYGERLLDLQQAEKLATDFVTGLLAKMGVEGQVKTLPQVECDQLRLEISGPDMGPIIGRRGDTLDAIQYLGSLVLNNALDEHVRLSVDTENYREKRAESLERLARKMAMKVVKAHRSMTLEPMNPYERRIIHAALQDFNGVTTYSTGTEPGRRVVIAPDNSYRNRDRG